MTLFLRYLSLFMLFVMPSRAQRNADHKIPFDRIRQSIEALRKSASETPPATNSPEKSASFPMAPMRAVHREISRPAIQQRGNRGFPVLSPVQIDTAYVGVVPNDTLVVSGNWICNGPVYVFNDGVLIFDHANATILGDIYIWGHGSLIADSTQFHIPQAWFYQRSLLALDSATLTVNNSSFEFSGMSHNFIFQGEAQVNMHHVYQNDWTTAGLWGNPQVTISDCNLMGEYIISGTSRFHVSHSDTLLLWQHYPDSSIINTSYPAGAIVNTYIANQMQPGHSGIGYEVQLDTCTNVWWGLMPVNGSDVTISNSTIRAIGCWFQNGDSVNASGLVNNSVYSNFTAPLSDRNLQFNNCNVQTWSLYVFDSSYLHITGCILGEVGTQYTSMCLAENFLLDGSGGYFWATDTSVIVSSLSSAMSIIRSERHGIFVFGYGTCNSNPPTAIGQSVMIVVQSTMPQDPVAEEGAVVWYANINGPATGYTNAVIPVAGTAFIDQGPQGSWMDFEAYSLYFKAAGSPVWTPIVMDSALEVRHGVLAGWNTSGLTAGSYELKLTLINNLGDSVDAQKGINLLPGVTGVEENAVSGMDVLVYPNPANTVLMLEPRQMKGTACQLIITDLSGKILYEETRVAEKTMQVDISYLINGLYTLHLSNNEGNITRRFSVLQKK